MLRSASFLVLTGSLLLAGCGRNNHENQWETSTGSPQPGAQPAAYHPSAAPQTAPGDRNETKVRGCLSGANELFTLVEERSASVYRLTAAEDPEAKPPAPAVFDEMKHHAGQMVEVDGKRVDQPGDGAPRFEAQHVEPLADTCPANLMGATFELNRAETMKVGMKQVAPREETRGSMKTVKPPQVVQPVNPAR
jgi:hypothetical protein